MEKCKGIFNYDINDTYSYRIALSINNILFIHHYLDNKRREFILQFILGDNDSEILAVEYLKFIILYGKPT